MRKTQNPRNILYLVLSIVIAAGIWYYVDESSGRVVTQTVSGIPIEYINEDALTDKGLMLEETENSGTSTTVDITFKRADNGEYTEQTVQITLSDQSAVQQDSGSQNNGNAGRQGK